jgi:small-conductance mechanosensitive channel
MERYKALLETVITWILENGPSVILVIVVTYVISHFLKAIVSRVVRRLVPRGSFDLETEEIKRENTLISIIHGFLGIIIWIGALFFILEKFGVPVAPLLTGAGILGVAVGFGSQSLVKDVINGIFIIVENQFRIGDVISVGEYTGTVEGMTLRTTRLRQLNGTIHYIPNGEIKVASNESKDFSMVDLQVGVGYQTKIDHLEEIINQVGLDMAHDPDFMDHIIEAPHFLRIEDLSDYSITARILAKVYPKHQYFIAGELRKRLKLAFEAHDIDIPYPTRIVHTIDDTKKKTSLKKKPKKTAAKKK